MPTALEYGVESVFDLVTLSYRIDVTVRGKELQMLCPNPAHNDTNPSCSVNSLTGLWHCFSCGAGGDIADLGSMVLGKPVEELAADLRPTTPQAMHAAVVRRLARLDAPRSSKTRKKAVLPEYEPSDTTDYDFRELRARLFEQSTLDRYGVRYVVEDALKNKNGEPFTIRRSIALPIRSTQGALEAWCYRRTNESPGWQPRYLYSGDTEISNLWFGVDLHHRSDHVSIVEGALDSMWLDQNGFPALGLLGSNMGDRKIRWLQQFKSITLVPDLDSSGVGWVKRIGEMLGTRMPVYVARYGPWMMKKTPEPDGSYRLAADPEELIPFDLELMHSRRLTWTRWANAHLSQIA
jgi:CHC2 zinc finger